MLKPTTLLILFVSAALFLAACGGTAPTAQPAATNRGARATATVFPATLAVPTTGTIPSTAPAQSVAPTTAPAPASDALAGGITADGFYFLGSPDAQVTLSDYSDFL